jgi:hypothetical protein
MKNTTKVHMMNIEVLILENVYKKVAGLKLKNYSIIQTAKSNNSKEHDIVTVSLIIVSFDKFVSFLSVENSTKTFSFIMKKR